MMKRNVWLLLITSIVFVGCTRKKVPTSTLVIQAPSASPNKVGSLSTLPTNRKACYGVNITAPDIPSQNSSCSPKTGIVGGFVESGQSIEVSVPSGADRKIELYLFLQPEGVNTPCPSLGQNLGGSNLSSTYFVGSATATLVNAVESVTITATFPGVANHIAQQFAMPATCVATTPVNSNPRFNASISSGVAVASGMRLTATVGAPVNRSSASGGGIRLKR